MRGRRWRPRSEGFLDATTEVTVRFHEVDAMCVVWHGHYLAYFEQARVAFGNALGDRFTALAAEIHAWVPGDCAYLGVQGSGLQVVV